MYRWLTAFVLLTTGDVAAILMQSPQIMLCKPSTHDRFDRRVIELAAFHHRTGHCNVPDVRSQLLAHKDLPQILRCRCRHQGIACALPHVVLPNYFLFPGLSLQWHANVTS